MSRRLVEQMIVGTVAEIAYCCPGWNVDAPGEPGIQVLLGFPDGYMCCLSWEQGCYVISYSVNGQEWMKCPLWRHDPILALHEAAVWASTWDIPQEVRDRR